MTAIGNSARAYKEIMNIGCPHNVEVRIKIAQMEKTLVKSRDFSM